MTTPELLTVREVATICRVHEVTIRRHIRQGLLRSVRVGRSLRIRGEDLERYVGGLVRTGAEANPRKGQPLRSDDPIFGLFGSVHDRSAPWVSTDKYRALFDE
jgi:excisionase family DNA binding protein